MVSLGDCTGDLQVSEVCGEAAGEANDALFNISTCMSVVIIIPPGALCTADRPLSNVCHLAKVAKVQTTVPCLRYSNNIKVTLQRNRVTKAWECNIEV